MTDTQPTPEPRDEIYLNDDRHMWAKLPRELYTAPGVTLATIQVYAELYLKGLMRSDRTETLQEVMAENLGVNVRTVQRAVQWLDEQGWIDREIDRHGAITLGTTYVVHVEIPEFADTDGVRDLAHVSGGGTARMSGVPLEEGLDSSSRSNDSRVTPEDVRATRQQHFGK